MIYCGYLICYLPFSPVYPLISTADTYIKIGSNNFYLTGIQTFQSFEFKQNRRGGEGGKIKFVKMFGNYKLNDNVVFYLNGKRTFSGVIERITDYGLTVEVIPLWGKLDYVFITDSLEYEFTDSVYNIVMSLKQKIIKSGIGFNDKNINIPKDIEITTSLTGRSIRDIFDELEKALPNNYCYGVSGNGELYFKGFSENIEKKLNWYDGHFSKSETETDYSNLFSQYVVKVKDESMNAYNVLKQVVGDDVAYPPTPLTGIIGKKTGIFEYNVQTSAEEALEYAYQTLKSQTPIEILKLNNLNTNKVEVNANECIETTLKPIDNFYEDFNIDYSTTLTIATGATAGELQKVGYIIGYARKKSTNTDLIDLSKQREYINACNRALYIYKIVVYYKSARSIDRFLITDDIKSYNKFGSAGVLEADVKGFSKRTLKVKIDNTNNNEKVVFYKMRCYFTQGSRKLIMNVREINYKYSKGLLTVDINLAKLNAVLTGYIFNREQKLKKLEALLTKSSE